MIYGIGTDICDVRRIRASLERHGERLAQRILSEGELGTWRARSAASLRTQPSHCTSSVQRGKRAGSGGLQQRHGGHLVGVARLA